MAAHKGVTEIYSSDFDEFLAEVTAKMWNALVEKPPFHSLQPKNYADLLDVVTTALSRYRREHKLHPK